MNPKKFLSCGALAIGSLITITGTGLVAMYVLEAIIARLWEPDQSLLFWYLPILFMGLIGILIGLGIGVWGAISLREIQQQNPPPDS